MYIDAARYLIANKSDEWSGVDILTSIITDANIDTTSFHLPSWVPRWANKFCNQIPPQCPQRLEWGPLDDQLSSFHDADLPHSLFIKVIKLTVAIRVWKNLIQIEAIESLWHSEVSLDLAKSYDTANESANAFAQTVTACMNQNADGRDFDQYEPFDYMDLAAYLWVNEQRHSGRLTDEEVEANYKVWRLKTMANALKFDRAVRHDDAFFYTRENPGFGMCMGPFAMVPGGDCIALVLGCRLSCVVRPTVGLGELNRCLNSLY